MSNANAVSAYAPLNIFSLLALLLALGVEVAKLVANAVLAAVWFAATSFV
jgi:hypothetical protein